MKKPLFLSLLRLAFAAAPSASANPAPCTIAGKGHFVVQVSLYVVPEKRAEFEASYARHYSKASPMPDGLVESYFLGPAGEDASAPFKHVTIWESRQGLEDYMKRASSGAHGLDQQTFSRRAVVEVYAVQHHRKAGATSAGCAQ